MDGIYEKLTSGKKLDEALRFFNVNNFEISSQGDSFFSMYGVGNNFSFWNKHERFLCYEELLKRLRISNQEKFNNIHKGTAYYFLYWLAFELGLYEKAIFYMDAAISEDIRKTLEQAKKEHPEESKKEDSQLVKDWAHVWENNPIIRDLCFEDGGSAILIRQKMFALLKEQIERFNKLKISNIQIIDISRWGEKVVMPLLTEDITNRSLLSTFYTYLLSYSDNINLLELRSINKGTIEPFLVHLSKGGLLFESLLKYLSLKYSYESKLIAPPTLGKFSDCEKFTVSYAKFETKAYSWSDVEKDVGTNDIRSIFSTVARLRNYTGHDLRRDDNFSVNYKKLVEREIDEIFIILSREFFNGTT